MLALGRSPDPPAPEADDGDEADGDYAGEYDGLAWWPDDPAGGLDYDDDGRDGEPRRRPAWVLVGVLVALLDSVVGVVGVMAQTDGDSDGAIGPTVDTAPPTSAPARSTTTTSVTTSTTIEGGQVAPTVTVAPPVSSPPTTVPRTSTTTVPPRPSTTGPPPATTAPPSTTPNPTGPPVREGRVCSPVGATAVTSNGTPVTCSTTACDGDNYDEPRWRRTTC